MEEEINKLKHEVRFLLGRLYLAEFEEIDGERQHPKGFTLQDWLDYNDLPTD